MVVEGQLPPGDVRLLGSPARQRETPTPCGSHRITGPSGGTSRKYGIVTYDLQNFEHKTSDHPNLTDRYIWWGASFPAARMLADYRLGAETLLVLEPERVSLAGIAGGRGDAYLEKFAAAGRELGIPVLLSFAPEANGDWYPWGARHISASLYIRMWRHVHEVIARYGGSEITWVWQVNVPWRYSEPLGGLWPGRRYVDEVGIDGQMTRPGETFSSVFGASVGQIRRISRAPVILSEVSVRASTGTAQEITSLFDGVCADHLMGVVLFDVHRQWVFDDNQQALAAFRRGATAGCGT